MAPAVISAAVEGITDEAVVRTLISHVGAELGPVYGKKGKPDLRTKVRGYNAAARHAPWLLLVDLDGEQQCASDLVRDWIPQPSQHLCFRVAVHATEAWLLADSAALAKFLSVRAADIPGDPDAERRPKVALVNLARRSTSRAIRDDMVPREGSGRDVGRAYTSRIIEFASQHWSPTRAEGASDSLRRAIACLRRLAMDGRVA